MQVLLQITGIYAQADKNIDLPSLSGTYTTNHLQNVCVGEVVIYCFLINNNQLAKTQMGEQVKSSKHLPPIKVMQII